MTDGALFYERKQVIEIDFKKASNNPITLRGITVRGKNRIQRGGSKWIIVESKGQGHQILVKSYINKEMFWMKNPVVGKDANVEVVEA